MLKLQPWISDNYKKKTKEEDKILLLGESHYGDPSDFNSNFTIEVVQDVIEGTVCAGYRYYTLLGKLFNMRDRNEIFNNCAFANLIQGVLEKPRLHPSKAELDTIHEAFWEILKLTKPTKVIVTSQRAWEMWLPDNDPRGKSVSDLSVEDRCSTVWQYKFDDVDCLAIGIGHPSSKSFYSWRGLVNEFITNL